MAVIIDKDKCKGCLDCVITCPIEALSWKNGRIVCDEARCVECGTCIEACEQGAITLQEEQKI